MLKKESANNNSLIFTLPISTNYIMIFLQKHIVFILIYLSVSTSFSQFSGGLLKKKDPLVTVNKSGPYLGIQRGKYTNIELGYEFQQKEVKLIKPNTFAANVGIDYNLNTNILGFSAGVWDKPSRIDFTYGASIVTKTDFDSYRIGVAPMLGYKFSMAHFQIGWNILNNNDNFKNTNTLFISLRAVLINNRNYNWRKRKKKE